MVINMTSTTKVEITNTPVDNSTGVAAGIWQD